MKTMMKNSNLMTRVALTLLVMMLTATTAWADDSGEWVKASPTTTMPPLIPSLSAAQEQCRTMTHLLGTHTVKTSRL